MARFNFYLDKLLYWVCAGLMFMMAALIFAQVVARYAFHNSITWSEELGRFIFVYMSFIGMAVAIRQRKHVALDLLLRKVNPRFRQIISVINNLLLIVLAIAIFWSGYKMVGMTMRQITPAMKLSMGHVYIVIPVSGLLMLYYVGLQMIKDMKSGGKEE